MKDSFDPYQYDKYLSLKVTPLLWLTILWSMHHALLLILSAFSHSGYVFSLASEYAANTPLLISNLPAIIVLLAGLNRAPTSGNVIRWSWRHGKKLLILAVSSSAVLTVVYRQKAITNPEDIFFWVVLIDAIVILYLLFSHRVGKIFSDFPVPQDKEAASANNFRNPSTKN